MEGVIRVADGMMGDWDGREGLDLWDPGRL